MSQRASEQLRVVIIDDHPIVRTGLTELINHQADMTVCGESDTAEGGLERIRADHPDVAIVDLSLGTTSGLQLIKTLNASLPNVRVLILSMHDETLHAERALAAGARGYIMKQEAPQNLIAAIRCVASGKTYVSPQMSERIVARVSAGGAKRDEPAPLERLTDREREVFALIGRGLATRDIATRLDLSTKTIETYQARIKEKLGLASGHELIRAAVAWTQI
ncbi:MAG: response regulator transcription factor [Vicinamibacterales bacterium]